MPRWDAPDRVSLSPPLIDWLKWLTEPSVDVRLKSTKQALDVLENSGLSTSSLKIATKPTSSKIKITNTKQVLEIIIPPQGFYLGLILLMPFAALWWSGRVIQISIIWGGIRNALASSGWFGVMLVICLSIFISLILWQERRLFQHILCSLFGTVRLRINQAEISLSKEIFGLVRLPVLTAARTNITKIEITPFIRGEGGNPNIPPQINIWAGTQKFELGTGGRLNNREVHWLAQNLSGWLGIPVTKGNKDEIQSGF